MMTWKDGTTACGAGRCCLGSGADLSEGRRRVAAQQLRRGCHLLFADQEALVVALHGNRWSASDTAADAPRDVCTGHAASTPQISAHSNMTASTAAQRLLQDQDEHGPARIGGGGGARLIALPWQTALEQEQQRVCQALPGRRGGWLCGPGGRARWRSARCPGKRPGRWSYSTWVPHTESLHRVAAQQAKLISKSSSVGSMAVTRVRAYIAGATDRGATSINIKSRRARSSQMQFTMTEACVPVRQGGAKVHSTHPGPSRPATASSHWSCPAVPAGSSPASRPRARSCAAQTDNLVLELMRR